MPGGLRFLQSRLRYPTVPSLFQENALSWIGSSETAEVTVPSFKRLADPIVVNPSAVALDAEIAPVSSVMNNVEGQRPSQSPI
jgi:hypothetical protein